LRREKNRKDVQSMEGMKREYDETALERKKRLDSAKTAYKMKKQLVSMMDDSTGNSQKLTDLINQATTRIADLRQEWEHHRDPMVAKLEAMRNSEDERRKVRNGKECTSIGMIDPPPSPPPSPFLRRRLGRIRSTPSRG
jgi:hypothetical protein